MGIGSLQKALAMQCGGILHLTQDELTIIVFPIKVFSRKNCGIVSKMFFLIIGISVMITPHGQEHTGKDAKISIDDYFHIEDQKEWTFYIGSKYVS